jgi:hypothetical protein
VQTSLQRIISLVGLLFQNAQLLERAIEEGLEADEQRATEPMVQ